MAISKPGWTAGSHREMALKIADIDHADQASVGSDCRWHMAPAYADRISLAAVTPGEKL
ncbi:hypothetical protein [Actinoplanes utahensis]|uniref:hypothetical protein n=1 Tax=Actinoplanes utahensis TaxID=1869 RepID=UPI001376D6D6|nr:hypothetical protein [Actinoplanes utahensis]GIF35601.1 hypothetical protein Aut01nite_85870 [Actinoplanes utahensis]